MPQELLFKAISHSMIGVVIVMLLLVLLIGLRREIDGDAPIRSIAHLGLVVMGLCTFLALMVGLFSAKKIAVSEISQRLDNADKTQAEQFVPARKFNEQSTDKDHTII